MAESNLSKISILLPTRGRPEVLKASISSLIDLADEPAMLEFVLAIDGDDTAVIDYVQKEIAPKLQSLSINGRAHVYQRQGYEGLHVYYNTLANITSGDWLMLWHDDALMQTKGWDSIIRENDGEFKLLAPHDNHNGHPYAIFPIVPRDWFMLMEHFSQHPHVNAWLSHVAYLVDIFKRIPVHVLHDRFDLTGNNDDATHRERVVLEGNPGDPNDFGHETMQNMRAASANKIAWFMNKIGMDTSWWQGVVSGEIAPLSKLEWPSGLRDLHPANAIKATMSAVPDDATLLL